MPAGEFLDVVDPWINWGWLSTHVPLVLAALQEHVTLTAVAVLVGLAISLPLGIAAHRWRPLRNPVLSAFGILYTIPSLALFSFLIPYTGLTFLTAEIGLVSYTLLILARNVVVGLEAVPPEVLDAADGMGYRPLARLLRIELPLALPAIIAGVRVATVTTIGLVTISATLAPGFTQGEALKAMADTATRVLPPTAQTDLNGQAREFRDSAGSIYLTFILALLFIYLVLSAQFESFVIPFVILLSVPLSMTGALFALWVTGGTWNIYSQIGLVTLVGLITKHGILIVEFSNQLRDQGMELMEAVQKAAVLRLRPILMTTGAMVLGALPLALAHGAGAESRTQIGWVIVGGMSFGTLLTLFVVPTAYSLLARGERVKRDEVPAPAVVQPQPGAAD